ncbi:antibiotic biosynthesis monooxygenase [Mycoplasmopsis ciconiae]|uniref:Antibiotic biosynthesis monooxygenase n=1 Tax=Mycoplasmopsis ciconiae TaxID=561067 RepID=A0ABU7MKI2_9BACT|nr:antibiotic biosynthesis monooxygenase [Mycoplasmopsis ciconiae]
MIYTKATKYKVKDEKMKGFVDYLYVFVKKARMETQNLSFEYGLNDHDEVVVIQRWSSIQDEIDFANKPEFKKELETLEKMAKEVTTLYSFTTIK